MGEDDIRKLVRNAAVSRDRIEKAQIRLENISRARENEAQKGTADANSSPEFGSEEGSEITNRSIRMLCKALLTDVTTRETFTEHPVPEYFEFLGETELLTKIWRASIDPSSPASVNAFIGTLHPIEQNHALRMMMEEGANITPELATECLKKLKKLSVQNQIAGIKAKLGAPNLPPEAVLLLNKQLLDLRGQLHDR